ncbi:hypothetical protein N9B95_06805 [Candidatus Pelagibacter sp.]|nr:hypothetical protein [Candidatus Pelagibacter sp.]
MESNPYNLKLLDEKPSGYLDADEFFQLLKRKRVPLADKDNLPRFANGNDIKMFKVKRIGSGGSTPTVYKNPTESKIDEILDNMKNNNNSLLGKEILKKKKAKILEIFDKAQDQAESRTSIAEKVAESLDVSCNRKLVRKVLDEQRSSELKKLKKIS